MRAVTIIGAVVALAMPGGAAHADMSLPASRAEPRWIARCSAALEAARAGAAVDVPLFAGAHVVGADVYLDENILGGSTPALYEAVVLERHRAERPTLEGAVVSYKMERWLTRAQLAHVTNAYFQPALDACVRFARSVE